MTATLPTIVPTGYAGDLTDFTARTKVDRSGAMRLVTGYVSVPSTTTTAVVIGLVPFNKGAKFSYGSRIYAANLDTSTNVTLDIGYTYLNTVDGTSDPNAFVSASSAAQSGGMIEMTAVAGMTFTAECDGWITATVGGGDTTTTGSLTFSIGIAYDTSGITNA